MSKLGLIAFANDGGLGAQTRRLSEMLDPSRIMVIDSSGFSRNKKHNFDWYPKEKTMIVEGFPKNYDILKFIDGLTHVLTVENPYNFYLIYKCRELGIKTYCQTNYEFCENIYSPHLPVPDMFLMPSYWMIDEMKERFGGSRVMYLPPPTEAKEFAESRRVNLKRDKRLKKKFLHIVGVLAHADRNGTLDLLEAVKLTDADFKLVIRSQQKLPDKYILDDPRVEYRVANVKKNADLYKGFDALILPRRYGGLSLTTNEALMSAVPVMMTDISPNNRLLPSYWLIPAKKIGSFQARAMIDLYSVDHKELAEMMTVWASMDLQHMKNDALNYGMINFSVGVLKSKYEQLFE